MPLRLVFMGTPDFAVPTLVELIGRGHEIAAVYTRASRPAGRGMAERRSAVHTTAAAFGLPVLTPPTLRDGGAQAEFAALQAHAAIVVAYGVILPQEVLAAPAEGCFNLHASLLPRWRGAAPIQRALMAGDTETGIMVMRMEAGLDTGPVCLGERVAIAADETAGAVHDRLAALGADLMGRALAALERGALLCTPQPDAGITYAAKIGKAETRIDWSKSATDVHNYIRALAPHPGAWCEIPLGGDEPERVKVLRANCAAASGEPGTVLATEPLTVACGTGAVRLETLQRAGKMPVSAAAFLRGARISPGSRLG